MGETGMVSAAGEMSPTQGQISRRTYTRSVADQELPRWTFLTNYGHVLLFIARDPNARLRDIADAVGITERAAQRIVYDLVEEGYVERRRSGRRNQYTVHLDRPLRHPLESDHTIRELMNTLGADESHEQQEPADA